MNFKHEVIVKISAKELEDLLKDVLKVPKNAKVIFNISDIGGDYGRGPCYIFTSVSVTYDNTPTDPNWVGQER